MLEIKFRKSNKKKITLVSLFQKNKNEERSNEIAKRLKNETSICRKVHDKIA
jgi:hypothetical protein